MGKAVEKGKNPEQNHPKKKSKKEQAGKEGEWKSQKAIEAEEPIKKAEKVKKDRNPKEEQIKAVPKVSKKSKKIKKTNKPTPASEIKKKSIPTIPKIENYTDFVNTENSKFQKIRQRTIAKIKLDKNLIKRAVKSLLQFAHKKLNPKDILETGDSFIYLEITLSQVPEKYSIRPIAIKLPVKIYSEEHNSQFCIISQDPQRKYKDLIQDLDIPCIAKVVGFSKLQKKFPTFDDKRKLCNSYDVFFCDYKIYNILRKPTGKVFYQRKKIPYPINCDGVPEHLNETFGDNYESYLNDLSSHTYFSMGNGPVYTVKVARISMGVKEIVKNIIHGVYNTIPHLLKGNIKHTKIEQISIKTYNSISLPIFNQLSPEEVAAYKSAEAQE